LTFGRNARRLFLERQFAPLGLPPLAQIFLDRVELANPRQGSFHPRRVESPILVVLPPRVRPTGDFDDPALGFQVDAVIPVEGVGLQVPAIVFEKSSRPGPLVIRRVVEHGQGMQRVAHVGPKVACVLQLPPGIANLHRR
jgi:hypothetical protein